jgi:hypothetical protein
MTLPSKDTDPILRITLTLAQYPILRDRIREVMREEIFARGVVGKHDFEAIVRDQAIRSQQREGLDDPYGEEQSEIWETRRQRVMDHLTDHYFAVNVPYELFEDIVISALQSRRPEKDISVSFNAELAPKHLLFDQARAIEQLPPELRGRFAHRLEAIKVNLIRSLISDQLAYVSIAKEWLTVDDLLDVKSRKMGYGRIGGKAAGMLLAASILRSVPALEGSVEIPESFYLGSDLMYTFMTMNYLTDWNAQKYKTESEIHDQFPRLQQAYQEGEFAVDIVERLGAMMEKIHGRPLIVRSSSHLEDNFGTSFAGKYDSYFCPNQGSTEENLQALLAAIKNVYASTLNPDALLYRRSKKLLDYDERMAILIQVVQGETCDDLFYPHAAGVGFSRNLYRWSPKIKPEQGFLRLVWGLGTRAVDRVGNDYPRLVALSHPTLRPEPSPQAIRRYSQRYIDLIDLKKNAFRTVPIDDVLTSRYPPLRYIAQQYRDGFLSPIRSSMVNKDDAELVLTFDTLLRQTDFTKQIRTILATLEAGYGLPVDLEFTVKLSEPNARRSPLCITIVQCRPQSHLADTDVKMPQHIPKRQIVFSTRRMVPHGHVQGIRYVLFVPPAEYYALPSNNHRILLARMIGKVNAKLEKETFICIGPGRWGTTNPDLGVSVGYADIYHCRALVELTGESSGPAPEPSYGTHFFQDLMESNTYPLAIHLSDDDVVFNQNFFAKAPSCLDKFLDEELFETHPFLTDTLRLIDVRTYKKGHRIELIMDNSKRKAVAFLSKPKRKSA